MPSVTASTPPWVCQVIHAEHCGDAVSLDLVSLDPCPFPNVRLPSGTPFVIRVTEPQAHDCAELAQSWADDGEVVTIRLMQARPSRWLCVSGGERHLLLEMAA